MDSVVGQMIGDYEVLGELGAGGMGKVYKVRNLISQRVEAMKVLLPDLSAEPELADRFLREIRISAGLEHPHIARLHSAQRLDNRLAMIMEFVEGLTLAETMRAGRIPLDRCLAYLSQALSALEYAHSRGVIHRDIKPGNIMITPGNQVKLMDFGIATLATDAKLTKTGVLVGSLHYLSPEQIEGHAVDQRSDLYSLGVTAYELVTGKRPFDGDSEYQIMAAHLKGTPQPPHELDASVPAPLNDIILTALARNAEQRFASATAMRNALGSLLTQANAPTATRAPLPWAGTSSQPAAASQPALKPARNHRTLYMTLGSLVTLTVLMLAAFEAPRFRRAQASDRAPVEHHAPLAQRSATNPAAPTEPLPSAAQNTIAPRNPIAPLTPEKDSVIVKPEHDGISRASSPKRKPLQTTAVPTNAAPGSDIAVSRTSASQLQPVAAPADAAQSAALESLQNRLIQVRSRLNAVHSSLQTLRAAQAASGVGLRRDMAAAEERAAYGVDGAAESLTSGEIATAAKRLDAAEADLDKLEAFLGR